MSRSPNPARRELWRARMERFHRSDLTVVEFCRRERVSTPSFYQWRKKLDENETTTGQQLLPAAPKFVPVVLTEALDGGVPTLRLPGGASVELPISLERQHLTELFAACIAATVSRAAGEESQ